MFDPELVPPRVVFGSSVSVNPLLEPQLDTSSSQQQQQRRARKDLTSTNNNNQEEEEINNLLRKVSGYGLSKWAAERLIENCGEVGLLDPLNSTIARIGMVSWNTVTGGANLTDWLVSLTAAIDIVGKIPLFSSSSLMNNQSIVMAFGNSMWKTSPILFKKQQEQLMSRNKFYMRLTPVNWMAEKIVGSSLTTNTTTSDSPPRIVLLDNAIAVEMVSQVWRPLIERRFYQDKDDENNNTDEEEFIATVVPEWQKFVQELKMREKARSSKNNNNTTTTTKGPSVSQRCELLFGMDNAPSGDRLVSNDKNDSNKTNLGIEKFCDFVSSF